MNFTALGIGRATVLCNNAELVNPCKVRRAQGVCATGTAKGCRCFMGAPMGANGVRPVGRGGIETTTFVAKALTC